MAKVGRKVRTRINDANVDAGFRKRSAVGDGNRTIGDPHGVFQGRDTCISIRTSRSRHRFSRCGHGDFPGLISRFKRTVAWKSRDGASY